MTPEERAGLMLVGIDMAVVDGDLDVAKAHPVVVEQIREAIAEEREACAQIGEKAADRFRAVAAQPGQPEAIVAIMRAAALNADTFAATIRARGTS